LKNGVLSFEKVLCVPQMASLDQKEDRFSKGNLD
jgi:hypothetical protein